MIKKKGAKKGFIITLTVVLLMFVMLFAVMHHHYTKEICVVESVDHMEQREGVSMDGILVEITYSIITNGEKVENCLYVFENGDVYSGYYLIDYANQETWERENYIHKMDNRYWDYLYDQCYLGRLSSHNLDAIINELAQFKVICEPDYEPEPDDDFETMEDIPQVGIWTGIQVSMQLESQAERTVHQENEDFYRGHEYRGRGRSYRGIMKDEEGIENLLWISMGSDENLVLYRDNEHAHNAIDIIKSTWAYEQWTNQIFGEDWEERIDLKDELEEVERERDCGWHWRQYWEFV